MNNNLWLSLIPILVPLLLALGKWFVPKIPKAWLPILAPVLGAGLDVLLHFAGLSAGNPMMGAILGSAGVGLREIVDQLRKAQIPPPSPPTK
jgi:hypothetical protein